MNETSSMHLPSNLATNRVRQAPLRALLALALTALMAFMPLPGAAKSGPGLFDPVARVNDRVVTRFELEQRIRFMTLLRAPGDLQKVALKALIEERLKADAASAMAITMTPEQVQTGMDDFAARAKLSSAEFIAQLASAGVSKETFRDFVRVGLMWREVVRTRFARRIRVTESEVDRAMAQSSGTNGLRVLLSELILPTPLGQAAQAQQLANQISKITSFSAFSDAAKKYSASGSRDVGGRLGWMPLSNLPAQIRGRILGLSPGKVTAPITTPNALVLFQLRAIAETGAPAPKSVAVDYASLLIPGGKSAAALKEATRIKNKVDTCDDLYGVNKGRNPALLERTSANIDKLPKDLAIELAKLDTGEVSLQLTRDNGRTLVLLMMCGRTPALATSLSRDNIRKQLANQRLASYADGYLAQLRADAAIQTLGQ